MSTNTNVRPVLVRLQQQAHTLTVDCSQLLVVYGDEPRTANFLQLADDVAHAQVRDEQRCRVLGLVALGNGQAFKGSNVPTSLG